MRRRDLLALAAGGAALPATLSFAQPANIPVIGVLLVREMPLTAFRQGLRDLGHAEGADIRLEIRSADGKLERLPQLAAELVRERVAVIVAVFTPAVLAAQQATREIPIVMFGVGDPVGMGIVASLAHPGGNITGTGGLAPQEAAKNVEMLQEALPALRRIAALCNRPDPYSMPFAKQVRLAGEVHKIDVVPVMAAAGPELDAAFARMDREKVEALIVQPSLPLQGVADLAIRHRLPAAANFLAFPAAGGLLGYGTKRDDEGPRAASVVDKILKGAKPADLPVEQPTKFELIINLKTAKALGLTVPQSLLARADEVIE